MIKYGACVSGIDFEQNYGQYKKRYSLFRLREKLESSEGLFGL